MPAGNNIVYAFTLDNVFLFFPGGRRGSKKKSIEVIHGISVAVASRSFKKDPFEASSVVANELFFAFQLEEILLFSFA